MERALLVLVLAASASFAEQPASVIPPADQTTILPADNPGDGQWAKDLSPLPSSVGEQAPRKLAVKMTIDHAQLYEAVVSAPALGVDVEVRRDGSDFFLSGYLKSHGWPIATRSLGGVAFRGGGIDVEAAPDGARAYVLSGPYKKEDGSDGKLEARVDVEGPAARDLEVRSTGLELRARYSPLGYQVAGTVDPRLYGKRELAIIGGAMAALTDDLFR